MFGVALFVVIDQVTFSNVLYFRLIAPQSALGSVAQAIDNTHHVPDGRRAVLLLGDSRVGEGFSARIATDVATQSGRDEIFVNGAVGGSYPRDWFYFLREMGVTADRFAAIGVMTTSLHDAEPVAEVDQVSDLAFIHPFLKVSDLRDLAETFPSQDGQRQALMAVLLRGQLFQADVLDLLVNPLGRISHVRRARRVGAESSRNYPGRAPSLTGLRLDPATGTLSIPEGLPAVQTNGLLVYARQLQAETSPAADRPASAEYRRRWFGRMADICAAAGIPLFVYRIPRGPLSYLANADEQPTGVLHDMRDAGRLRLLPAAQFNALERPEYFFDQLHLDSAGRAMFSTQVAHAMLERMPAAR